MAGKTRKKRSGRKRKAKKINVSIWAIAAVIAALTALICMPYLKDKPQPDRGAKVPDGYYCYGIDISKYQPQIRWDSLKVLTDAHKRTIRSSTYAKDIKNISFAFIKATEGVSLKDKHFRRHWKNAHKAGKTVGICGELAADAELTEWFIDIGVDELSVVPAYILKMRQMIRQLP